MNIIGTFDPSSVTTPFTFTASSWSATGKLVIYNESNIGVQL